MVKDKMARQAKRTGKKYGKENLEDKVGDAIVKNLFAKKKRGEKMRKKGAKGAPKASDFKRAKKTARKK